MSRPFPTIRGQHGLATTPQLLDAGWTRSALHHLATHSGRQVHRGVYADHRGTLTGDQLLVASWLWAGPDAVLTSMSALARHGLAVGSVSDVRFLTGTGRARRQRGVSVVRTTRVPRARLLGGLPTAPVERALADAARFADAPAERARALTIAALQDGLTSADRLVEELRASRPNGTLPIRLGLDDFTRGAWSLPEVWLEQAIRHRHPESIFLANPCFMDSTVSSSESRTATFPSTASPSRCTRGPTTAVGTPPVPIAGRRPSNGTRPTASTASACCR